MVSRSLLVGAVSAVSGALASSLSCPVDAPLSCQNTTSYENTCCFNYPGGDLLLTQFWDTDPSTGPADSWTIHGLWPDNCDGSYDQFCDTTREYTNITDILKKDAPCVLDYMSVYWKDYQGNDESFYEHEFSKHGTCISTLNPSCYDNYRPTQEVKDYFYRAVKLFQGLPSYKWLAEAGIVPSTTATYTLANIQAALSKHYGHNVIVNCNSKKELDELWYHYHVQGNIQTGTFVPVDPVGSASTCPSTGIKYLPKYQTPASTTTTSSATATSTRPASTGPAALSGKGYFYVDSPGLASGSFLISGGTWYRNGGTPATYTATPVGDGLTFTLNTSKGKCLVANSVLTCAAANTDSSAFGFDGTYLTYGGSNTFYTDSVPSGTTQATVYTAQKAVSLQAYWSPL
ncbi:ribonuclease t2 [Thozetella sp. PMI_491]|nr:ribonuclease t2 [Thozetella sp. PMI_491]